MRHAELQLRALDGLPEADVHLVFQIAARLLLECLLARVRRRRTSTEKMSRNPPPPPAAARCACAFSDVAEVEAAEVERNFLILPRRHRCRHRAGSARATAAARISLRRRRIDVVGVEPELVVNLALLGIAENVVGLGDCLELLLRGLVADSRRGDTCAPACGTPCGSPPPRPSSSPRVPRNNLFCPWWPFRYLCSESLHAGGTALTATLTSRASTLIANR